MGDVLEIPLYQMDKGSSASDKFLQIQVQACRLYLATLTQASPLATSLAGQNERHKGQTMTNILICGKEIQHDASGVGHDWRWVSADSMYRETVEEIAGAITDGLDSCPLYIADGGQHYRW